jgi:prepilin-type N-terminal cleavage/methylation domain-containing protein
VRRFARDERGMSLIELLVVMPMMGIVLLSIYALNNVGVKAQTETSDRVSTIQRQQNGLERMTREMRQAVGFTPVSSQIIDAETYVRTSDASPSVQRRVRYECLNASCVRYEGPSGGALTSGPQTVVTGVRNVDIFFFEPNNVNPNFVSVKLEVGVKGATNPVTLDGGFALRNEASG